MNPTEVQTPILDADSLVDYARSLDCIHCGLCLHTCPTYQLTGNESSSPRGRIHLMRGVAESRLEANEAFAEEMDFCLVCRHCESVCPAGVELGAMMEFTRDRLMARTPRGPLQRVARWLGLRVVLPDRRWLRLVASLTRFAQWSGATRWAARLFGRRRHLVTGLPPIPKARHRRRLPQCTAPIGPPHERVLVLEGCVMPELLGEVNRATVRSLAAAGVESRTAPEHTCCGALHAHNGDMQMARRLARETIAAFSRDGADEPIVVNSAGCGAHMKELGRILASDPEWSERARAFAARVVDYSEFLGRPDRLERLRGFLGQGELPASLAYDDPCHLCHGQGIREEPRRLLDALPGTRRVELEASESCCGSAGVYSILRPEDSQKVLDGRLRALRESGARALVTGNPGCQLQWRAGIRRAGMDVEVLHVAECVVRSMGPGTEPAGQLAESG